MAIRLDSRHVTGINKTRYVSHKVGVNGNILQVMILYVVAPDRTRTTQLSKIHFYTDYMAHNRFCRIHIQTHTHTNKHIRTYADLNELMRPGTIVRQRVELLR